MIFWYVLSTITLSFAPETNKNSPEVHFYNNWKLPFYSEFLSYNTKKNRFGFSAFLFAWKKKKGWISEKREENVMEKLAGSQTSWPSIRTKLLIHENLDVGTLANFWGIAV